MPKAGRRLAIGFGTHVIGAIGGQRRVAHIFINRRFSARVKIYNIRQGVGQTCIRFGGTISFILNGVDRNSVVTRGGEGA